MECSNIKIQSDLTQQRHKDEALTTSKSYPGKMDGTRCVRLANKNRLLAIRTVSPAVPCKSFFEPASSWAKECTPVVSVLQMPRSMTCQWQRKEKVGTEHKRTQAEDCASQYVLRRKSDVPPALLQERNVEMIQYRCVTMTCTAASCKQHLAITKETQEYGAYV